MDEPFADTSMIPMYYLAEFARNHVTVCLSGDGSDEIFAGYSTYSADRLRRFTGWIPAVMTRSLARVADRVLPVRFSKVGVSDKLRRFLHGHALSADRAHYFWRIIFHEQAKHDVLHSDVRKEVMKHDPFDVFRASLYDVEGCHYLDRAMYVDIKTWLVDDILVKVDRATMAHSIEARTPFLDHRLVEFAASLPVSWKYRGLEQKHLLRYGYRNELPEAVLKQRKQGFNAPVSHWLNSAISEMGRQVTTGARMRDWFDANYINGLWDEHQSMQRDHGLQLFGLTCLGLWMEA
jgi:asparagine synthase (glutamine-hydrolysing)